MGKRFGNIYGSYFTNENLGIRGNSNTCHFRNDCRRLSDDFSVYCAGFCKDDFPYFIQFFFVQYMAAAFDKFSFYFIINISQSCYRLFGSTNHTIVESLGMNNGIYRCLNVTGTVHNNRYVSRTYADSRFAGGIRSLYHARAACS